MLNVKGAELTGRRLISNKFILVDRTILDVQVFKLLPDT